MVREKIVVLGTGGTIAGTAASAQDHVGYAAAQLEVAHLVRALPGLEQVPLHTEQVAQVDSKDMDFAVWQHLAARCAHWLAQDDVQGIVVTHGTDTLEETAWFLQQVLGPSRPVVLTCAMRPATALSPDGPQNLLDAVAVAREPGARGVLAVCAGWVHAAADVVKHHPYRLDAFTSGEVGPVAAVEQGRVRLLREWPATSPAGPQAYADCVAQAHGWPRVEIVLNHVGAGGAIVHALLTQGVDGIVAAGTGNGSLSAPLQEALLQAQARGVKVVRSTRCHLGRVLAQGDGSLPDSGGLSPVKARVQVLLDLLVAQAARAVR